MPKMRNSPDVTGDAHPIILIVDVLPAPFGPRKPKASPGRTSKSIPATAVNVSNRLVRERADTSDAALEDMVEFYPRALS